MNVVMLGLELFSYEVYVLCVKVVLIVFVEFGEFVRRVG